jgi:CBS domain containing-hemolysin-like protein
MKTIMLILNILLILLLVFLNGFFIAAEFAFVSVRRAGVEAQARGGGRHARDAPRARVGPRGGGGARLTNFSAPRLAVRLSS